MTRKKRDLILIATLTVLLTAVFLVFQLIVFKQESSEAQVFYRNEVVATVDFDKRTVTLGKMQSEINTTIQSNYPTIENHSDGNSGTIALQGDYDNSMVVIEFNYNLKTMQVIEETSPRKVCSFVGASTFQPIECRPNNIRITFKQIINDDVDGVI